jgi:hypothetical protein
MRAGLTLFSLFALIAMPVGVQAQGTNWGVRQAPQSWGRPAAPAPQANQDIQQPVYQRSEQGRASPDFSGAVTCAAALQLATMAAPNWGQERGITNITNAWLQKVFALAEPQGIGGDQVPALVEAEMQRQVETAAQDPATLSRRAFDCASRQP